MVSKKHKTLELNITGMAFGGKGIAKHEGLTVFVDRAVQGDSVIARILKKKKNYAEAVVTDLLVPSEHRITPPCKYHGYCGGCKWQFLKYEQQLVYKCQHVKESLDHIGLVSDVEVHPTIPSLKQFGYRNKMEFSCSNQRWLLPEEMQPKQIQSDIQNDIVQSDIVQSNIVQSNIVQSDIEPVKRGNALGFHVPGTFHKVLDIKQCLLQEDIGNELLNIIRSFMNQSGLDFYDLIHHQGFWRFCVLRQSQAHKHWMVNIVTREENIAKVKELAQLLMATSHVETVVNNISSSKAGVAIGEREIPLEGPSVIQDRIGDYSFLISANSFFQTNTMGANNLYNVVKNYARLTGKETVLDLYSGIGTIPIWLSNSCQQVKGIEIVESSIKDAERNCKHNGISNCDFIHGDIKESLSQITIKPDVVVIDPPRDGMHKHVLKQVCHMSPPRIVYISCNPSTLARDIAVLKDIYHIVEVQPVDMFPHTYHIESVARLEKK